MSTTSKPTRWIARVTVRDPPPGLTLREWHIWRQREDQRMEEELAAQREAIYELLSGEVTVH